MKKVFDDENYDESLQHPILVFNYDESMARILYRMFTRLGFKQVYAASTPQDILSVVREVKPRIMIRDYHYPGMEEVKQILLFPRGCGWEKTDEVLEEYETHDMKELEKIVKSHLVKFDD